MFGSLPDSSDIGVDGALGISVKLKIFNESFAEFCHGWPLFYSVISAEI